MPGFQTGIISLTVVTLNVSAFALVGLTFQAADEIRLQFYVPSQFVPSIV